MKTEHLVSIVIPVYNRAHLITETVNSAINQTYHNIEIIIVDNKSTDNTFEVINNLAARHPQIKIYQNESNIGPVRNWKACFDYAVGDFIKILWSDDLMAGTFVADAVSKMDVDTAFVISEIEIFDSETREPLKIHTYGNTGKYAVKKYLDDILMFNRCDFPTSPGCTLFRADDLRKALIIDVPNTDNLDFKKHGAGNDLLLFLIVAVKYRNIEILPYCGSNYREHKQSLSILYSDELLLFHEWARLYFVKNYYQSLLGQVHAKFFLKSLLSKKFKNLSKSPSGNLNIKGLVQTIFKKIGFLD